jgi:DeoR/GlpR family transcriptional regulator of sugar metabolism
MTVRRDVDVLADRDALIKTLGGAQYTNVPQFLYESALSARIGVNRAEKDLIAEAAMRLVQPQQTLYLDGSSTCIALARLLAKSPFALTVITNSAIIAMEAGVSPTAKVLCLGGEYDPQSASFVGVIAEEASGKFFVDTAFMSTRAFSPEEGMFESSIATLRIKQLMAQRSSRLVLLVDHSKFGQRALCKVLDIGLVHTVVTDAKSPKSALEQLRIRGRQVVVAGALEAEAPTAA